MIWSLQSLRFVAALMVVYVHAAEAAYTVTGSAGLLPLNIVSVGLSGVDLFFVLLVSSSLRQPRVSRPRNLRGAGSAASFRSISCAASRPFLLRCRMASYGETCWQRSYCGRPPT